MSNVQSMKYYIIILIVFLFSCKKDVVSPINITDNTTITPPKDSTFLGYKVDTLLLKTMGAGYWKNTGVPLDVIVQSFQKPYGNRKTYGTFLGGLIAGDFNGDGWIDVFNVGAYWEGVQANFTFLIWNPLTKIFEEKNLFNDKSFGGFTENHGPIPIYLNGDNYCDLILIDNGDESKPTSTKETVKIVLSDGKGGYDLKEIKTNEDENPLWRKEGGDVGDLNEDGIPDLVITCNMFVYIYWGIKDFPYFITDKHATFVGDVDNFGYKSNNGFNEKVNNVAGNTYWAIITDFNKDGKNDIVFGVGEDDKINQRILINQGNGRFNSNGLILLPNFYDNKESTINQDYIIDDINGDGLNDLIALRAVGNYQSWDLSIYFQNKNGGFSIDKNAFQFTINSVRKDKSLGKLIYFDFNKDGKKDIGYIDGADNGQVKYKSVFIRTGDKYIEEKLSKYDSYAGGLINKM